MSIWGMGRPYRVPPPIFAFVPGLFTWGGGICSDPSLRMGLWSIAPGGGGGIAKWLSGVPPPLPGTFSPVVASIWSTDLETSSAIWWAHAVGKCGSEVLPSGGVPIDIRDWASRRGGDTFPRVGSSDGIPNIYFSAMYISNVRHVLNNFERKRKIFHKICIFSRILQIFFSSLWRWEIDVLVRLVHKQHQLLSLVYGLSAHNKFNVEPMVKRRFIPFAGGSGLG